MKSRRRIRKPARKAPKVRRCACVGGREGPSADRDGALMIGGAKDPAEARAEARAARALSAPPIRRKCAACAEEEARRSAPAPAVAPAAKAAPASHAAETAVAGLGAGRPLSRAERGFYEPRLGADFSRVRLHEDAAADRAARAMDAAALTLGRDIAFARGAAAPRVMAHELAHVAEEGAPDRARRVLKVFEADKKIPPKKGKGADEGLDQTNGATVQTYLDEICDNDVAKVQADGEVETDDEECVYSDKPKPGCDCICEIDARPQTVEIHVRDHGMPQRTGYGTGPHTVATEVGAETGKGAGSHVIVPSPNDSKEYGYADVKGVKQTLENWEILGHELCGHALLNIRGTHPGERPTKEVRHGHETVVPMENAIRQSMGVTNRDRGVGAATPYCGESFSRNKGAATFENKDANHLHSCRVLRAFYLERLKQARKKLPPDEQANLTPLKPHYKYDVSDELPKK